MVCVAGLPDPVANELKNIKASTVSGLESLVSISQTIILGDQMCGFADQNAVQSKSEVGPSSETRDGASPRRGQCSFEEIELVMQSAFRNHGKTGG